MGKPTEDKVKENDRGTKILFKKSVNTLYTHTRTNSMMSELVSQTSIQTRKDQSVYYSDKRDMSTETVMCKLRRYCKRKTNKAYNHRSSVKSTIEDTDVDIEEYPDTSACGDNDIAKMRSHSPINVESLLLDNLKHILNKCIQKNLFESKDRQQKIDNVLNSILHKLNTENGSDINFLGQASRRKERENRCKRENTSATTSGLYQHYIRKRCSKPKRPIMIHQKESSSITIPCQCKKLRGISTLSIPRTFHKRRRHEKKSKHNMPSLKSGKIKPKNIIISIGRSTKILDSSSFDLLAISTKSLTKRCVDFDFNVKKKHIVFLPKASHSSVKEKTTRTIVKSANSVAMLKEQLYEMPSLLKSLYANDPAAVTSLDKTSAKNDNFTMTDTVSKEAITQNNTSQITTKINNGFENNMKSLDQTNRTGSSNSDRHCNKSGNELATKKATSNTTVHIRNKTTYHPKRYIRKSRPAKRRLVNGNNLTKDTKSKNTVNNKQFNVLLKKVNSQIQRQQENIQKQFENLFNYCTEYNNSKKVKVDVRINVFPYEYKTKDVCANVSNKSLDAIGTKLNDSLENVKPTISESAEAKLKSNLNIQNSKAYLVPVVLDVQSENLTKSSFSQCVPQIFTLLDGADSQAKYMFAVSSREKSEEKTFVLVDNTVISKDGLQQKINNRTTVAKEVTTLVSKSLPINNTCPSVLSKSDVALKHNPSKDTQVLMDKKQKEPNTNECKDPKKKVFEFYNRLGKKSTSYRIIDSESILKVTDMTSKADQINNRSHLYADQALMCCLPKSRSLFEMTDNTNKLIAFFCGNQVKPDGKSTMPSPYACNMCCTTSSRSKLSGFSNNLFQQRGDSCIVSILPDTDGNYSTTFSDRYTSSISNEGGSEELCKVCKRRKRFGCCLGFTFCLLIWVPIIVLVYLFYTYDVKDWFKVLQMNTEIEPKDNVDSVKNPNRSYVKLSVLGF